MEFEQLEMFERMIRSNNQFIWAAQNRRRNIIDQQLNFYFDEIPGLEEDIRHFQQENDKITNAINALLNYIVCFTRRVHVFQSSG